VWLGARRVDHEIEVQALGYEMGEDHRMPLRDGKPLESKKRELPFSFFPVGKGKRRYEIFDIEFASNPWAVMRRAASVSLTEVSLDEALAYLDQGEAFYETARGRTAAHPLLHYYAMLNVGKAVLLIRGFPGPLERAHHGLADTSAGAALPELVTLKVKGPSASSPRVFRELLDILGYPPPVGGKTYNAAALMAQVVIGHRLWREATHDQERFLVIESIQFMHQPATKQIWLRLRVDWPTMQRHGMRQKELLPQSGLDEYFELVQDSDPKTHARLLWLEQVKPVTYTHRATENVLELVNLVRPLLWRIVSAVPGSSYRRYYVYLDPSDAEEPHATVRVSQIEATWALMFYLGSVVRYRPHRFHEIANGAYGPFVDEFISVQAEQLLYLLASEACRREIARPAII
jgi:hypothetical protein